MKKREPILIQMEILVSLFASPKVDTRLAQSGNVNMSRIGSYTGPMLAKGLIRTLSVDEVERGPQIIDAHQELVSYVEQTAGRIRALSAITVVVALVLAASYFFQLLLPLVGTTTVTVNLSDPSNVAAELVVLLLVLIWLYVGFRDLRFSTRLGREIRIARSKEKEIQERIS